MTSKTIEIKSEEARDMIRALQAAKKYADRMKEKGVLRIDREEATMARYSLVELEQRIRVAFNFGGY